MKPWSAGGFEERIRIWQTACTRQVVLGRGWNGDQLRRDHCRNILNKHYKLFFSVRFVKYAFLRQLDYTTLLQVEAVCVLRGALLPLPTSVHRGQLLLLHFVRQSSLASLVDTTYEDYDESILSLLLLPVRLMGATY